MMDPHFQVVTTVLLSLLLRLDVVHPASHPHITFTDDYTYDHNDLVRGPKAWQGDCRGSHQSPIDVRYRDMGVSWGYTKIKLNSKYQQPHKGFYASNPGHTFLVQFNADAKEPQSDLIFSAAGLHDDYTFSQMHLHWGDRDEIGSEHTLQGQRFPLEIHLVHYKSSYGNLSHALHENSKDHEAVAVFSVLAQLGGENAGLRPVVDVAKLMSVRNPSHQKKYSYQSLSLLKILPKELDFARYEGSLTTPPCTQKVVWTVFLCPISVSVAQLETFRRLLDSDGREYYNYRPLQRLNGRKVKYYKVPGGKGVGSSMAMITQTLKTTLQEVNSVFNNFLSVLSEAQFCDQGNYPDPNQNDIRKYSSHIPIYRGQYLFSGKNTTS